MKTAGTAALFTLCFVAVVAAALQAVAPLVEGRLSWRQVPASGWVLWLCVAVPSLAQIPFPGVYRALHRDADAVTSGHQWWRLLTSVVVQDGGVIGTVSNLLLLALALVLCLPLWGPMATITTSAIVLVVAQDGHGIAVGLGFVLGLVGMPFARRVATPVGSSRTRLFQRIRQAAAHVGFVHSMV